MLSRTDKLNEEKLAVCVEMIREHNEKATIITTPWEALEGKDILETIEGAKDLEAELMKEVMAHHDEHEHHHHHHDHGPDCTCGCHAHEHHDHDHDEHEHHHDHEHDEHAHHHEHDEHAHHHCEHDEHEHDHGHDEHTHHHDHDGHHHHADEIFTSWGLETPAAYEKAEIKHILAELDKEEVYGIVLRAKGMVPASDGGWIYFDYVPEESNVRDGKPDVTGKFCVIGSKLNEDKLTELFKK